MRETWDIPATKMAGSTSVLVWWICLSAVSVVNVAAWIMVAVALRRSRPFMDSRAYAERRWQLVLSSAFVFGCAFRSFLPRVEAQRFCLYDSWISNAMIARAVATVAELCLVAQVTLLLRACARGVGSDWGLALSRVLLPLIALAELFSWYTTLTTNFMGSVVEESMWATTFAIVTFVFVLLWARYRGRQQRFLGVAIALNAAYVVFMCTVDVPMYWSRLRSDQANGRAYMSLSEGWSDSRRRWVFTRRREDWREEIPWMSLYFTTGVWISISLVRAPRFESRTPSLSRAQSSG